MNLNIPPPPKTSPEKPVPQSHMHKPNCETPISPVSRSLIMQDTNGVNPVNSALIKQMKEIGTTWISTTHLSSNYRDVAYQLPNMTHHDLQELLRSFFAELAAEGHQNPIKLLDGLASILTTEKLLNAPENGDNDATVKKVLTEAQNKLKEAEYYFKIKTESPPSIIKKEISKTINGIITLIGTLTKLIDITTLADPENPMDDYMIQWKFQSLTQLFTLLSTLLLSYAASAISGPATTGILICIGALCILWKFVKPMPGTLPHKFVNWTQEIRNGEPVSAGRKEALDAMAHLLETNRHPMLVAPSRTGKNETVKALTKAIEQGDYPELKGKTVFYVSTASISTPKNAADNSGTSNILSRIHHEMGRHGNNIILVFDEIHNANKLNSSLAEDLKNYLDGKFPHVIGITTENEYNEHIAVNEAFAKRFVKVEIKNTDKTETMKIMTDYCIKLNKTEIFDSKTLERIFDDTNAKPDVRQPFDSINRLKNEIGKTEKTQESENKKKLAKLKIKAESIISIAGATDDENEYQVELEKLEKEIAEIEVKVAAEEAKVKKLFLADDLLIRTRSELYSTIRKISKVSYKTLNPKTLSASDKKQLSRFLLISRFMRPQLRLHVDKTSSELNLTTRITYNK